jgi:pimeloyl-ACP methyl ester carboxylesterase
VQELYIDVQGKGPALVLIPGGGGDAGVFADAVPLLVGHHTVITYDRRGNSRSPLDRPDDPIDVGTQADDVIALLDRLGVRRAAVFGNSGGAIIALDLIARHSDRLTSAVVHEPPAVGVLEGASLERTAVEGIFQLGQEKGTMQAFAAFGAMTMPNPPWLFRSRAGRALVASGSRSMLAAGRILRALNGRQPDTMTRMLGNVDVLITRELPAFCFDYDVDTPAIRSSMVPWVLAVGDDSAGLPYDRPAKVLSERTAVDCVIFPGGHTVYQEDPAAFAERLVELVRELEQCREQD